VHHEASQQHRNWANPHTPGHLPVDNPWYSTIRHCFVPSPRNCNQQLLCHQGAAGQGVYSAGEAWGGPLDHRHHPAATGQVFVFTHSPAACSTGQLVARKQPHVPGDMHPRGGTTRWGHTQQQPAGVNTTSAKAMPCHTAQCDRWPPHSPHVRHMTQCSVHADSATNSSPCPNNTRSFVPISMCRVEGRPPLNPPDRSNTHRSLCPTPVS
jgi:hypothetical protein